MGREYRRLALWMLQIKAVLAIPVKVNGELKAFFLLGEKKSGLSYFEDIKELCHIANLSAVVTKSDHLYKAQLELKKMVDERSAELKKAQDELLKKERLAAIGTLANEVSHELRNPIQVLNSDLYVLEKKLKNVEDKKVLERLQSLKKQMTSMNKIISNMLDFSRSRELKLEKCNVNELVKEAIGLVEIPSQVRVHLELSNVIPEAKLDTQEIRQAMINLVTNAYEAMPEGGPLQISSDLASLNQVEIKIQDTGYGIPKECLDKIFEPFNTTKIRGNGLGMAVVKKIVDRHKGTITVESEVNKGTTFTMRFPLNLDTEKVSEERYLYYAKTGTESM
jgi:signal transduction histidine kinase